jgi:hypothetical protein
MKKNTIIFLSGMAFVALFSFKNMEDKDKSLARAEKVNGKYIFVRCEPMQDYDVAFILGDDVKITTKSHSIDDQITACVEKCLSISEKKGKPFDAMIYGSGQTQTAIKFK